MMDFFYDIFGIYGPEFIGPTTLPYSILVGLLKLSLPAGILIAAVLLARQLLRKAPKWISCALWALVALRLICPFTIESPLSVMPNDVGSGKAVDAWMDSYVPGGYTVIYEGEPGYVEAVGSERLPVQSKDGINYVVTGVGVSSVPETVGNQILPYLFCGWVFGMTAMLLYAVVSYLRLKRRTAVTVPWAEGVLMCDEIDAPFILGVFRSRIYLPSRMTEPQLSRVLAHEKAHLKRHDHWWKPLGFLLLSVYWFNPLVWIAYILFCRDIEMACDERVVRDMGTAERADYAQALLDCSRSRRVIAACPLAFGEVGVKERVKGVLNYKKPAFWIILIAIIACIVLAVCLMTDPFSNKSLSGKLGVSMDMAVAEHNRSSQSEGRFIATDYDVLLVSESGNETTVYAWVLYEEYSFDGRDAKVETGSHIPVAITFDTSANDNDSSTYDVIEYWEPRDGSYYADDIGTKFPWSIRGKALDITKSEASSENCLRAAKEYFKTVYAEDFSLHNGRYVLSGSADQVSSPYLLINEGRFTVIQHVAVSYQPSGTIERSGNTVTMKTVFAGETYIWVFELIDDNQLKLLLGDSIIPVNRDNWEEGMVFTLVQEREADIDMEGLQARFPDYLDLPTSKGLEVYVWQMAPGSYSCGVLPGTNREKTLQTI